MLYTNLKWTNGMPLAIALLCAAALTFAMVPVAQAQEGGPEGDEVRSPDECATCHAAAFESWSSTMHANTSQQPEFISAWAEAGQSAYCRECHGTGYDASSGTFALEDVTCQSCHLASDGEPHPSGQMSVDTSAELCSTCHSGVHSPTYEEWLLSDHGTANIDCLTCHQPHTDNLRADSANELCGRCHQESTDGSVHNIGGVECSFCHMYGAQQHSGPGEATRGTGHTFEIPPDVCAACHGMTHTLTAREASAEAQEGETALEIEVESVDTLQDRVVELEEQASENLDLGIAGGGLGGLVLGGAIVWAIRRGKDNE